MTTPVFQAPETLSPQAEEDSTALIAGNNASVPIQGASELRPLAQPGTQCDC